MNIKVFKYDDNFIVKTIDNFDNVKMMFINLLSDDEVLNILYNDGTVKMIDPCWLIRFRDAVDYSYVIYDATKSNNLIDNPVFMNRTESYWIFDNPSVYNEFRMMHK